MKYIIDIPHKYVMGTNPRTLMICEGTIGISTEIELTPYDEPSQKAIDLQHAHDIENVARMNYSKGSEDAWEFARAINDMLYDDFISCYDGKTEEAVYKLSYHEAKSKYEAWKKQKDEIRVGDEVIPLDTQYDTMVVTKLWTGEYRDEWADIIASDGKLFSFLKTSIKKTGRHFNEVEELLKKMKEKEE